MRLKTCCFAAATFLIGGSQYHLFGQAAPQNFVSVTPCRVADTRSGDGGVLTAKSTRTFTVQGVCGIPTTATAYSLNITVVPATTLSYLTIYPTGQTQPVVSTINDSFGQVIANAAIVPAGSSGDVSVYVTDKTNVIVDINGYFSQETSGNSTGLGTNALNGNAGNGNTGVGFQVLSAGVTGGFNTGTGSFALQHDTAGESNTGYGYQALYANTTGNSNTALGVDAMYGNLAGSDSVAVGYQSMFNSTGDTGDVAIGYKALYSNNGNGDNVTGDFNVAIGYEALENNTTGGSNTAVGANALLKVTTGSGNIALGEGAGQAVTTGSNNIIIGNPGGANDDGVIRIGVEGTQTEAIIAGIYGTTVTGGEAVLVNGYGQLGVASSSIRYKEDVQDMSDASDDLMKLRPVTFRYKQAEPDGSKPVQYGLIGEEVEKVLPQLVSYTPTGEVSSVQYHELPALLLNELQKQRKLIEEAEKRLAELEAEKAK